MFWLVLSWPCAYRVTVLLRCEPLTQSEVLTALGQVFICSILLSPNIDQSPPTPPPPQ